MKKQIPPCRTRFDTRFRFCNTSRVLGPKFVPHLIDYDDKDLWHETELILGAKPLAHRLVTLPSNQVDAVVTDLIAIDRQLYIHRIDYRAVSIDHILIGENGDAYLTGSARTRINHAHEDILFDSVLGSLAKNFGDSGMAHAFAATLAIRRDEVYRLPIRAARSAVHELIRGHDKRRVEH